MVLLVCPGISTANLANNRLGTILGTAPTVDHRSVRKEGRVLQMHPSGGSSGVACVGFPANDGIVENFTVFWFGYADDVTTPNGQLIGRGKDGSGNGWNFYLNFVNSNSLASNIVTTSPLAGYYSIISGLTLDTTTFYRAATVRRGTTLTTYFWNTRQTASATVGSGLRTSNTGLGLARANNDGSGANRPYQAAAFSGALTNSEIWSILDDPLLLFEPQRISIGAAAAAAGVPTLSLPTYMPGSLTATGFRPRVTAS